jgi:hypothetical protein
MDNHRRAPDRYERSSYTETKLTIIFATFCHDTFIEKFAAGSNAACDIEWDPEKDKKMRKTKVLWPKEMKTEKTSVEYVVAKFTRAKRKKTVNSLQVTRAEREIMWAFATGNRSHGEKMAQAEKAFEIKYDADSRMQEFPYVSKQEHDKKQKDPVDALI